MKISKFVHPLISLSFSKQKPSFAADNSILRPMFRSLYTTFSENQELGEFMEYMDKLKNYEKMGVPKGAGTESDDGFDLARMRRLLCMLGNPQSKFKAIHIAGTKGKGSTAAFISGILRAEGYSVGCYSSPHILSIRERITLGTTGELVSIKTLKSHFQKIKKDLDVAVQHEKGHLSHFEVFTALACSLFAEEKVHFAVIEAGLGGARDATNVIAGSDLSVSIITNIGAEHLAALGGSLESIAVAKSGIIKQGRPVVLGGPFLPHIECIIRDKASSMSSPVVSACDPGNRSILKGFLKAGQVPCQLCDIKLLTERDLHLSIELVDVRLRLLGTHQLQNAATACLAALCLRSQGWNLSDGSIRSGLERAVLLGRSQFLTPEEAGKLNLPGATILCDGAHTKESAQALVDMIEMIFPGARLVFVVAMANDKDHLGFARVAIEGGNVEAVCFTEIDIAGERYRRTPTSVLRNSWAQACIEKGVDFLNFNVAECEKIHCRTGQKKQLIVFAEGSFTESLRFGHEILREKPEGIIVATGSLHIVSAVLRSLMS